MAKILLVEDDNNLREIYGARLGAEGYEIVSAPDGEEALAIAVKEKPDLIISDIMMPKISGFDMLDILRNAPETKDTKIIMMTALSQAEDKERADKLGADLYLVKSQVTLEDVAESVRKILGDDKSQTPAAQPETPQPADTAPAAAEPPAQPDPPAPAPVQPEPVASASEPGSSPAPSQAPTAPAPAPVPEPAQPADAQTPATVPSSVPVATPPSQDDAVATAPAPPADPVPAAAPAVQTPPAVPPAPTPAADNQPAAKPEPKKIEVVLPDDDADKPAITEEKPAPDAAPATDATAVEEALSIGPNVAEALAQEESSNDGSGKVEAKKPEESASAAASQPSSVIKPNEAPAIENPVTDEPTVKQGSPNEENNPNRKVIQPLNDPNQGPDLNALLEQEQQREQSTPPAPSGDSQNEHPDDFSKISL
jgi:CheY-like chemotaxis protein